MEFKCHSGTVINSSSSEYYVDSIVGRGTFGKVARCSNRTTNENVALKITRKASFFERAKEEGQMMEMLKSQNSDKYNIVRWDEAFTWNSCYCLAFELLDEDLHHFQMRCRSGRLGLEEIRPILKQLVVALDFLQRHKVAHADLKPKNIMVVDHYQHPPRIKIIDFGLATVVFEGNVCASLQTLWYRAPEIVIEATFTEAIDVWSLGCIAVEMFLGEPLFPAKDNYDLMLRILHTLEKPSNYLLHTGMRTSQFFRLGHAGVWSVKSLLQNGPVHSHTINSLDYLLQVPLHSHLRGSMCAEINDRATFVELLKMMLKVNPSDRISAPQILQDAFITMSHFEEIFANSTYFETCFDYMEHLVSQEPNLSPAAVNVSEQVANSQSTSQWDGDCRQ
ncbi:homeodomain-interacting protein kinase 1-like isoform X1 [Synchiropus splendidus]|uniref:homeodomain-interacting protein kinase 1-like isoform X1 n=1 Tax=Synchiropus splendidus TaxID=270530 RepID=UPI00237E1BBE|nr:homeodomain-interacting protein kinase 1-like isoform X1 [Synchiropus splendidus]